MTLRFPSKVIYADLSYKIIGLCFKTHNELGRYCREKQYADLLARLFYEENISFKREFDVADTGIIVDFLIENKIILELKTQRIISKKEYYQVQRYLQITGAKLGLLINFRSENLNPKRIVRIEK